MEDSTKNKVLWHYSQIGKLIDTYKTNDNNIRLQQMIQDHLKAISTLKEKPMKKMSDNNLKPAYLYKERNIYKVGTRYRVRVAGMSNYTTTLKKARIVRSYMKVSQKQGNII